MEKMKDAAAEFLANKRVAVTGVSRKAESHGANVVYTHDKPPPQTARSSRCSPPQAAGNGQTARS
jgi:hypothetical protein